MNLKHFIIKLNNSINTVTFWCAKLYFRGIIVGLLARIALYISGKSVHIFDPYSVNIVELFVGICLVSIPLTLIPDDKKQLINDVSLLGSFLIVSYMCTHIFSPVNAIVVGFAIPFICYLHLLTKP